MGIVSFVRRAIDGPITMAFADNAAGVPATLTLDKPQCPLSLRRELTDAIDHARALVGGARYNGTEFGRAAAVRSSTAFSDEPIKTIVDLADIVGVTASKSGIRFAEIEPNADIAYLMGRYHCSSAEELLQSGFARAFRDFRRRNPSMISATRFGARGPLYFCNIDGSHRIAAARAEFLRLRLPRPLAIDVTAIEPDADVLGLLEQCDVVVASMPRDAITDLFDGPDRRRAQSMRATMFGPDVLAVVRRRSRAGAATEALARAGRLFSLRAFLTECGCRIASEV